MKTILLIIAMMAVMFSIAWVVQGNDFFMYKVFAPKYEQVRRETYEQSKAYNQGMIQEIQNMQMQYVQAKDQSTKDSIASIILHRVADYDMDKLPSDTRAFVDGLKRDRGL